MTIRDRTPRLVLRTACETLDALARQSVLGVKQTRSVRMLTIR